MKNFMKRGLALFIAIVWCVTLIPVFETHSHAATVDYNYASNGKYVYNWGQRGTVATFMSPMAEAFYADHTSYEVLSTYSGASNKSDVPNSALYKALNKLVTDAQSYVTSYDATKSLFQYTDCQNGGGKISSFYSGKQIGPSWDGGWNREHTWPNSKGEGSGENDIMMLRPTSTSENSSRGNTAYGKSSGYYNPNKESNNTLDLRGDVARIFLYVYVRWGNLSTAWGTGGVMESPEVMLEWMEADPVDTWELGRNDAVQSITGTRNVFVDYPELAFQLFEKEVPKDMTTPSSTKCNHNNFGTTVVAATCDAKGYTLFTCKVSGCGYSYKASYTNAKGHNYVSGTCTVCGGKEVAKPTFVTSVTVGKAYKLGFFSTAVDTEYYFSGTMSGYYGATDTATANAVDVFVETANGGYYLYFKDSSNKKQYINLVLATGSDGKEHYNFTFGTTASSVYTWDSAKNALKTDISGEPSYIGTYGTYYTMSVLTTTKLKDTDYIARLYTTDGTGSSGGSSGGNSGGNTDVTPPAACTHKYDKTVVKPNCVSGGFTVYTCSLCGDTYTGDKTSATGHNFSNNKCTVCGAEKSTSSSTSSATISFADTANRTEFSTSKQVWVMNGITVTNNKSTATSNVADYSNPARFYKGSDVIIEYPGITKLEINVAGLESRYVDGWLNAPSGATATENNGIITVVFSSPVNSVTYTGVSAQCRAFDITVYTSSGSGSGSSTPTCAHTNTTIEGAKAPTCTVDGYTGDIKCTSCKQVVNKGVAIKTSGHNWVNADCDTPKTCSKCQATEGSSLGHNYGSDNTCDRCGATNGSTTPDNTTTGGNNTNPDGTTEGTTTDGGTHTTVPDVTNPVDTTDGNSGKGNNGDNNIILPIIIGVVVGAAIGAVVVVIILKKKK